MSALKAAEARFNAATAQYLATAREARQGTLGRAQVTSAGQVAYLAQIELDRLRKGLTR